MNAIRITITLVFAWSALKAIAVLAGRTSMDFQLYAGVGLLWLLYLLLVPTVLSLIAGVIWVWRPFANGFFVSAAAVALNLAETLIAAVISARNIELAKKAFVISRKARGLPVRQEILQMMDSTYIHLLPLLIGIPLAALWLFLLSRIRNDHLLNQRRASRS